MAGQVEIGTGTTPSVTPDAVSVSHAADVWFEYELTNVGDEDDTSTGFYFTVDDLSGTNAYSDYAPDQTIPAGGTVKQGCKIDASVFDSMTPGDYWVSLRSPQGETLGAALLTVAQ